VPLGLVVLKSGAARSEAEIIQDLIGMVRDRIGPVAAFKDAQVVSRLPKTRSGKILRGTLRKIADGEEYVVPPTIDDPAILGEMEGTLRAAMR
jgi:propionyl-CoA synthetase